MVCKKCNSERVFVIDTRNSQNNSMRRRRKCLDCGYRFTTYEMSRDDYIEYNNEFRNGLKKIVLDYIDMMFEKSITDLETHRKG